MIALDIQDLYTRTFGSKPFVPKAEPAQPQPSGITPLPARQIATVSPLGHTLQTEWLGREIWLPVWFRELPASIDASGSILMPYSVVRINQKKNIIKTALAERRGTVKELYSLDDYEISVKGFLIDEARRQWPEEKLVQLRRLFEYNQAVRIDNALLNLFLTDGQKVVIEEFDLPEVEGGRKHVRPFSLKLCSDEIFKLELT